MISKELLSEVLGINEEQCGVYEIDFIQDYKLYFKYDMFGIKAVNNINIYELAHLCKEWAYRQKQSYRVTSGFTNLPDYDYEAIIENPTSTGTKREIFEADSEPEAIFKACQWILDNKDK